MYEYKAASIEELERRWDINIANNPGDNRWVDWKTQYIENNKTGKCKTFVVLFDGEPIGEGTLLFSPECVRGNIEHADGINRANINALRIEKAHEGKGHISKLVKLMEQYAIDNGYKTLTIGVEATETRNMAIYLHWGYTTFVTSEISEIEEEGLVLVYSKLLKN
ncbi:MAG: GNAT family N-acetyltransferase [Oscillospiraceae bacterium]|nr:GNAT family N-acetyltransferase [Oscillospiraceae bacterium]